LYPRDEQLMVFQYFEKHDRTHPIEGSLPAMTTTLLTVPFLV
jgi:hypothetical protein